MIIMKKAILTLLIKQWKKSKSQRLTVVIVMPSSGRGWKPWHIAVLHPSGCEIAKKEKHLHPNSTIHGSNHK